MCVNFYNSLKEIGATAPVLTAYGCYGDPVPTATGGGPVGWTFFGLNDNQRADTSPEATLYRNVMTWADKAKFINVAAAPMAMADVFAIANMSNSVGFESLSGAAYETAIKTLPNPLFLVPGTIKCGVYPDKAQVGLCGDSAAVSSYSGTQWQIDAPFKAVTLG